MKNTVTVLFLFGVITLSGCQMSTKSKHAPFAESELSGQWRIESIAGAGVMDYSPATLSFSAEGKLAGNASCNRFFGRYTLRNQTLIITGPLGSTRKMCAPALMKQEAKLLKLLPGSYPVEISDGILVLYGNHGTEAIRAARVD